MLDILRDVSTAQGIEKDKLYEAVVVDNNDLKNHPDKRALSRVTFRVAGVLFKGMPDAHLPWAIPGNLAHTDGASSISGKVDIPKPGTKIIIKFQGGSIDHPVYYPYAVDNTTVLEEALLNYPDRKVHRFQNGALMVVDTHTNEVFIRNPGALNLFVEGDLNVEVTGSVVEKVLGNKTTYVQGNLTEIVDGNRFVGVRGNDTAVALANRSVLTHGTDGHHAGGDMVRTAPYINDDVPGADLGSVPAAPSIAQWQGIRGNTPT